MRIEPAQELEGEFEVPGDKSISHRYGILGAMASGLTTIRGFSSSRDCWSTLACVENLGCSVRKLGSDVEIESSGWRSVKSPADPLDAGNSGTTIRLLSALLSSAPISSEIGGDESLNNRPMARIVEPLSRMGAQIEAREGKYPPLSIEGRPLTPTCYELPVASAQVKSCVLLAGLTAAGKTTVIEKTQSRDHTERTLPVFGVRFEKAEKKLSVWGPSEPKGTLVHVLGVNPTRSGLLTLLRNSGARITLENEREVTAEPWADVVVRYEAGFLENFPAMIESHWIPNLIDEIPILAVLGTRLKNGLRIRNAAELRHKESDRIRSIVQNLGALGIETEEYPDGFNIPPGQALRGGKIRTFGDHRIAMSFAVAGLLSKGGVQIDEPECADISFPGFFDLLDLVSGSIA
jgi:3-phosphoshikimate 1-carboxyvinyltransferase